MKSLICSDIHDHISNLENVLHIAVTSNCNSLIVCGDLCSPFIIDVINKNYPGPVHIIFGNNDGDQFNILNKCKSSNTNRAEDRMIQIHGPHLVKFKGSKLNGIPEHISLAVYHYPEPAESAFKSGDFDFIFYGHTHIPSLKPADNKLIANPGSVMGYIPSNPSELAKPSCLIVDWDTGENDLIEF